MDLIRRLISALQGPQPENQHEISAPASRERVDMREVLDRETQLMDYEEDETLQTRPLAPPKPFKNTKQHFRVGQLTDTGQVRRTNQDACLTFVALPEVTDSTPSIGFFVVADGMGGHRNGEIASSVTVQTLASQVLERIIIPHLNGHDHSADEMTIPEVLVEAMDAANDAVQQQVQDGGTTATCAVVRGDIAYIAHVGDSRAYLIADDNMELITRDHSLVRRLQELGQLTAEEAEVHPNRNVLYRAIGQGEALEIDTVTRRLPPESLLLLCSDGMWGVVGDPRIAAILEETADPQEACDRLVEAANIGGGPDNITAVLVQMPE